jgi:hypothetical protein
LVLDPGLTGLAMEAAKAQVDVGKKRKNLLKNH